MRYSTTHNHKKCVFAYWWSNFSKWEMWEKTAFWIFHNSLCIHLSLMFPNSYAFDKPIEFKFLALTFLLKHQWMWNTPNLGRCVAQMLGKIQIVHQQCCMLFSLCPKAFSELLTSDHQKVRKSIILFPWQLQS